MKKLPFVLICMALSTSVAAQDFLQQWRDSAAKAMNEFRAAHKSAIDGAGWRFVTGTESAENVPVSDVFIKTVRTESGTIRSAYLLNALYVEAPASDTPAYHSTKLLVWFDCRDGTYQQRILERYASVDGTGIPVSREAERQESAVMELVGADRRSYEKPLLAAICTSRM
jgi:hypothetical protein